MELGILEVDTRLLNLFEWETSDMRMDVTDVIWKWLDGTVPNEGFMIKRSGSIGNF